MSNDQDHRNNNSGCCKPAHFVWNELVTSDLEDSASFYSKLFGWSTAPHEPEYTLFKNAASDVAGMMKARHSGTPPQWRAYVSVDDVDGASAKAAELGGQVLVPPLDIPDVGRIAIIADPQGAAIGLFKPLN